VGTATIDGGSVGEILDAAVDQWGGSFAALLAQSQVWVNGEMAVRDTPVHPGDEVAVIPPVSGGAE
jgi:molybdopterin synthase sulfur carrier subunit